jgi:hypothetical protein
VLVNDSVSLVVTRSSRNNRKSNNTIGNFKRGTSRVLGGYLTCEKIGLPLTFKVHRAPPSILTATAFSYAATGVELHSHHNVNWGEEVELAVPLGQTLSAAQPLLSVTLSNGESAVFCQSEILENAGHPYWIDVGSEGENKSRLQVQFDCFLGNDKVPDMDKVGGGGRGKVL